MAIVTTSGSLSSVLQTGYQQLAALDAALQAHLNYFVGSFNHANTRVFSYAPGAGSTSMLIKHNLQYQGGRTSIEIAGSGFKGFSGSVKSIAYSGIGKSWELDGSGKWTTRGLHSLTAKQLSLRNDSGTEFFTFGGSFSLFKSPWKLQSLVASYNGLTFEHKGRFDLSSASGTYSSVAFGDDQGKVTITGKIQQTDIHIAEQLGDIFDNPDLFKGNDTFNVSDNSRPWLGFAGNDTMRGGALADELYGCDGNDKLYGYAGDDVLIGGNGNDLLDGGEGDDYLEGGPGNDTYKDLYGDNIIFDEGGNNKITTGAGEDLIITGDGKDTINAGAGDDVISAGGGVNKVTGGAGADAFVLTHLGSGHITTLLDFKAAEGDFLVFDSTVFASLAGIDDLTGHLVVGVKAKALDADDFLIYDSKSKKLYYDADGSGQQAAVQIAVLKNVSDLSADDISVLAPGLWLF
jgi:Ca2+-binding RTX toxin-like protein